MVGQRTSPSSFTVLAALGVGLISSLGGCHKFGMGEARTMPDNAQTFLGPKRAPVNNTQFAAAQQQQAAMQTESMAAADSYASGPGAYWSNDGGWNAGMPAPAPSPVMMPQPSAPAYAPPPPAPQPSYSMSAPGYGGGHYPAPAPSYGNSGFGGGQVANNSYAYAPPPPPPPPPAPSYSQPMNYSMAAPPAAGFSGYPQMNQTPAPSGYRPSQGQGRDFSTLGATAPVAGAPDYYGSELFQQPAAMQPPLAPVPSSSYTMNFPAEQQYAMTGWPNSPSAPVASVAQEPLPQMRPFATKPANAIPSALPSAAPGASWAGSPEPESYQQASYIPLPAPVEAEEYVIDEWGNAMSVPYDDAGYSGNSGPIQLTPPRYAGGADNFLPRSRYGSSRGGYGRY